MADWIPGISQAKSLFQAACGDFDGAAQTQENFLRQCPVVSQVTSAVQFAAGYEDEALETQASGGYLNYSGAAKQCLGTMSNFADGIPIVGHLKGAVHYAVGDDDGGDKAMISATRTTAVMGGGAAGLIVGGPVGAVAGGIYAGVTVDSIHTIATEKPQGYIAAADNIYNNPSAGGIFDSGLMIVGDGLTGMAGGKIAKGVQNSLTADQLNNQATKIMEAADANKNSMTSAQYIAEADKANALSAAARKLESGGTGQAGNSGGGKAGGGSGGGGGGNSGGSGGSSGGLWPEGKPKLKGGSKTPMGKAGGNVAKGAAGQAASSSSGSQQPNRPQRDGSASNHKTQVNWPKAESLEQANRMLMKEISDYIKDLDSQQDIPNNARQWICDKLQDGPMNEFYERNASAEGVVQIDYTFEGVSRDGTAWRLEVQINADFPNTTHGHPHHYGGEVNVKGMNGKTHRTRPHVEIPAKKFKAGRATDKNYKMKEFGTKSGEKKLDGGGSVKWEYKFTK
ncbi:unnamed protein product [Didymodactylos carnosus]|uniref:Uncharacterized protein n=1 Tax=Didymodactylos carnosus TaxID=1234261 RepID=A0A8S2DQZ2_9BILA|nr:unnamed protein product [Didymodactylos carnosus]CAF3725877.1 unnamed protein product [Didymodactylos carnosus]